MKKHLLILVIFLTLTGCSEYKFGILESNYPEYFGENSKGLNRVLKYNKEYSWLTNIPVGSQVVEIEHGVIASEDDLKKVGLPSGRYLFFSLNNKNTQEITKIKVNHSYKNKLLDVAGTYLFTSHRLKDGSKDPSKTKWKVMPVENDKINEQYSFGYIKVFKLPPCESECKSKQFDSPITENIEIIIGSGDEKAIHKFEFELYWHKASTFWWTLSTIT